MNEENENTEVIRENDSTEGETPEGETTEDETQVETPDVVALQKELEEARKEAKEKSQLASKHANESHEWKTRVGAITRLESGFQSLSHVVEQIASELNIELKPVETPKPDSQATEGKQSEDPAIIAFRDLLDEENIAYDDPEMLKTIEGKTPKEALRAMRKNIKDKERGAMKKEFEETYRIELQKQLKSHGVTAVETGGPTAPGQMSEDKKLEERYPTMTKKK